MMYTGYVSSGSHMPLWIDTATQKNYEILSNNISTDVLIIGGGLAGVTSAYCLTKEGYDVVLVEDGWVGSGETGRTTAHFTYALDDRYEHLEKVFGYDGAKQAYESHKSAIDRVEETVLSENINCHFTRINGYLLVHPSDTLDTLHKEYESAKRLGIPLEWIDKTPHIENAGPCLKFPDQGQLHIMKYMDGLADAITRRGGKIYTQSRATHVDTTGAIVNGHTVSAQYIIVATNNPIYGTLSSKQFPYRSYVVAFTIPKKSLAAALRWDTGNHDVPWEKYPYHYVRTEQYNDTHDILIVGGEDHKTGQADGEDIPEENRYEKLVSRTKNTFPMAEELVYQRSGQVTEPADAMAYLGRIPGKSNMFVITGDSGNGMTHCTIGARLITDLIAGRKNPWTELYSPARSPMHTLKTYVYEVANLMLQYGKRLTPGERDTLTSLKADEGAILRDGLKKVAVYRDANGTLHMYSAVCPHMKGILVWNNDEKSFDCPVHGSRFSYDGKLLMGPAYSDLPKYNGNLSSDE